VPEKHSVAKISEQLLNKTCQTPAKTVLYGEEKARKSNNIVWMEKSAGCSPSTMCCRRGRGVPDAAIIAGDKVVGGFRVDPDVVEITVGSSRDDTETLAAVFAHDEREVWFVDFVLVFGVDDQVGEIKGAPRPSSCCGRLPAKSCRRQQPGRVRCDSIRSPRFPA
jgi:hypothetical protein